MLPQPEWLHWQTRTWGENCNNNNNTDLVLTFYALVMTLSYLNLQHGIFQHHTELVEECQIEQDKAIVSLCWFGFIGSSDRVRTGSYYASESSSVLWFISHSFLVSDYLHQNSIQYDHVRICSWFLEVQKLGKRISYPNVLKWF